MSDKHICFNCGQEIRYDEPVSDEDFIEALTTENCKLQAQVNLVKHELRRVIKANGAEPSWAQELLDRIEKA